MSVQFVQTDQLMSTNGVNLMQLNFTTGVVSGSTRNIPCVGTTIVGAFWRLPVIAQGIMNFQKFDYLFADNETTKPRPDAIKVLRVKWGRETYEMAIEDTDYAGSTNAFGTLCDGLGGSLATMPEVDLVFPIIQDAPTSTDPSTGIKTFTFAFPLNPDGLEYAIPWPWFNGIAPATAYAPTGLTTAADFVTWANANWGDYGTWDDSGDIVTLASDPATDVIPVTEAGLGVSLAPATYCLDLTAYSTPAPVNGIKFGSSGPIRTFGAFMLTDTSAGSLITAIRPFFDSDATFTVTSTSPDKVQITSVLNIPIITYNGTNELSATLGACA